MAMVTPPRRPASTARFKITALSSNGEGMETSFPEVNMGTD
jgi:hypothetical protein